MRNPEVSTRSKNWLFFFFFKLSGVDTMEKVKNDDLDLTGSLGLPENHLLTA